MQRHQILWAQTLMAQPLIHKMKKTKSLNALRIGPFWMEQARNVNTTLRSVWFRNKCFAIMKHQTGTRCNHGYSVQINRIRVLLTVIQEDNQSPSVPLVQHQTKNHHCRLCSVLICIFVFFWQNNNRRNNAAQQHTLINIQNLIGEIQREYKTTFVSNGSKI